MGTGSRKRGARRSVSAVVESVLPVAFAHVASAGIHPDRVAHDAVEDGIGDDVASQLAMPFLDLQLDGVRSACDVMTTFEQERFEPLVGFIGRSQPFLSNYFLIQFNIKL